MKIGLASDHAGFKLKDAIKKHLKKHYPEIKVYDYGTNTDDSSSDYPIFASKAANALASHNINRAIFMCGSGIGISIAASKIKDVMAPLIYNEDQAVLIREYGNANAISLSQNALPIKQSLKIVDSFLNTKYNGAKTETFIGGNRNDKEIWKIIKNENNRQKTTIELIASENFVSQEVMDVTGSILTNKYAEGYSGARYYGGCEFIDQIETLAIERLKKLFNAKFANVQPHSGSQANLAAFAALINPGDRILGMSLDSGGHLTHGHKVNFSGKIYESSFYKVDRKVQKINYNDVLVIAREVRPKLIIAGASAYSRKIDFKKFREIADDVGAYLLADVAHIAGLIVTNYHESPMEYAHIVTSTTHKTLRGPRGGIILTNDKEIADKIDKSVFPGNQGGPLMHVIAAKAVSFKEALEPSFKEYIGNVVHNCKTMEELFLHRRVTLVSGGSDNHLLNIDVKKSYGITGKVASDELCKIGIIVNKNTIPFDDESPKITSGIRIGTAAMTTHGFDREAFKNLADIIDKCLRSEQNSTINKKLKHRVDMLLYNQGD